MGAKLQNESNLHDLIRVLGMYTRKLTYSHIPTVCSRGVLRLSITF